MGYVVAFEIKDCSTVVSPHADSEKKRRGRRDSVNCVRIRPNDVTARIIFQ